MFVKITATEYEQCIRPEPLTDEWVEVPYEEAICITNNREWEVIPNPDFGKVIEQRTIMRLPIEINGKTVEQESLIVDIFDDRRKIIIHKAIVKTTEEIAAERDRAVRAEIAKTYSSSDELKLMNAAIEALAGGYKLPQEYEDYRATVAAAKEKAP